MIIAKPAALWLANSIYWFVLWTAEAFFDQEPAMWVAVNLIAV